LTKKLFKSLTIVLCLFSTLTNLSGQEKQELDSLWNDWNFRISPYFWFIGLEGTIYRPPQPANYPIPPPPQYDIDVGFKDIKNSIKFALMLAGQYRNKHLVAQFNYSALILESEAITPFELVLQDNIVKLTYMAGDLGVGYRIIKNPKFEFEGLIGMKFLYFKIDLRTNLLGIVPIDGNRSKFWIDPVIATNLRYRPHRKIEFAGYADFGPPFPDNINSYQAIISAKYLFTKTFMIALGYRTYHLDFPRDEAIFNGNVKGWYMKIGFQF